jgi:hypothetical protein
VVFFYSQVYFGESAHKNKVLFKNAEIGLAWHMQDDQLHVIQPGLFYLENKCQT